MNPTLKRYYLMHFSYWIQQLIVLILKIEKPRKDFNELAIHHVVTLWLIGLVLTINDRKFTELQHKAGAMVSISH